MADEEKKAELDLEGLAKEAKEALSPPALEFFQAIRNEQDKQQSQLNTINVLTLVAFLILVIAFIQMLTDSNQYKANNYINLTNKVQELELKVDKQ